MIKLSGLTKQFVDRKVLDGVSLEIERGETVAVMGPSGTGKTTLLRCINGLARPDRGRIEVAGSVLDAGNDESYRREVPRIRQRVGFVFQQCHLFGHRTVLENVIEAPVHVRRVPVSVATQRATELLDEVGVLHRLSAHPHHLSGGEQQRVAIARALAMDPEALLLDEPTSALDEERTFGLVALLKRLSEKGLLIVAVTHDTDFAQALASRVVVLRDGRVAEDGDPRTVLGPGYFSGGAKR